MKKLVVLMTLSLLGSSSNGWADTIDVQVNGMVCSFCAQGLTKKFKENKAVDTLAVDLDKKTVTVTTQPGQTLTDEDVKKIVDWAGYTTEKIERK